MLWQQTLVASLLAIGAQAGVGELLMEGSTRNSPSADRRLKEIAKANLRARGFLQVLETRQSTGFGSNTPLNPDGSIDMEAWDEVATAACREALRNIPLASNPSGTCVCYNLPGLNNVTGEFGADLRLFQLSEPTGDFQGIPQDQIKVGLSYRGASATQVSPEQASRMAAASPGLLARQEDNRELKLLQSYLFLGQVDTNEMMGGVTLAQLQALVMPVVTLSATNAEGRTVSTNVSSNEAAFVAGVFSQEKPMSSFRQAELIVEEKLASLNNGTVAFVLPGVQLMIFPVGLIITSVWMVAGFIAYGIGTYARYNFREQHKARMARAQKAGVARI
ncbi:hypothetical protein MFIFM68171_08757 [Madurella fahalii]|uniref:Uncharacterized protein n=1 Tax=Madurella fahalii TaxID=1157608 RepID=A0ABQ0GLA6_9PEZI